MALILKAGNYYRMRCATCGQYMLTMRRHARTCSALCRQLRKRGEDRSRPEFVEDLGWKREGERVAGKLAEKLARQIKAGSEDNQRTCRRRRRRKGSERT